MKVVLDTNIFLSGLMLPESVPGKIVAAWHSSSFNLVFSEPMLIELARVLAYPKIEAYMVHPVHHLLHGLSTFKSNSLIGCQGLVLAAAVYFSATTYCGEFDQ